MSKGPLRFDFPDQGHNRFTRLTFRFPAARKQRTVAVHPIKVADSSLEVVL